MVGKDQVNDVKGLAGLRELFDLAHSLIAEIQMFGDIDGHLVIAV
jgi:hypothetical protein